MSLAPRSVVLAAAAVAAACVPPRPPAWVPTQPSYVAAVAGFEVVPPPAWMRSNGRQDETLVLTRDGTSLQRIVVGSSEVGKPIGIGASKRPVQAGMSPQELAELVIDDLRAAESLTAIQILENAPATLSGRRGFRVVASFRDARGLPRRLALYGLFGGSRLYELFYLAPERHYFARDLPVFEELARSFRLREPGPPRQIQ
jgi:hypothetical protein